MEIEIQQYGTDTTEYLAGGRGGGVLPTPEYWQRASAVEGREQKKRTPGPGGRRMEGEWYTLAFLLL